VPVARGIGQLGPATFVHSERRQEVSDGRWCEGYGDIVLIHENKLDLMRPGCQGIELNRTARLPMHEVGMGSLITHPARTAIFADRWSIVKLVRDRVIVDKEMHPWVSGRERHWRILNIERDEHWSRG
jgi:hypothetical protein